MQLQRSVRECTCFSGRTAPALPPQRCFTSAPSNSRSRRGMRRGGRRQPVAVAAAATVEFAKYQGLGNDFILVRLISFGQEY